VPTLQAAQTLAGVTYPSLGMRCRKGECSWQNDSPQCRQWWRYRMMPNVPWQRKHRVLTGPPPDALHF
jgi:hypothetical protein